MRLPGKWLLCEDGFTRPVIRITVTAGDGTQLEDDFLIDIGADQTVFSEGFHTKLKLLPTSPSVNYGLIGIGGGSNFVIVTTVLELARDDGGVARVRGDFAAFTDPQATDLSILGRDVLDHFDVIVSRPRNEILLLAGNHQYQVT